MKTVIPGEDEQYFAEAIKRFREASHPVALTGAGISVGSGIPDFRSADGLWQVFSPDEYATLDVFMQNPAKAWQLYRAMGTILIGKEPNTAHLALAELENRGLLYGVITQNVDNLHQLAGNTKVLEIHGDHLHLQCIKCGKLIPVTQAHYQARDIPQCEGCEYPLKPNVVLFGESVRSLAEIHSLIAHCDLLMVVGTSAQVFPAAELPLLVKQQGGLLYEFNTEHTSLSVADSRSSQPTDFFMQGDVCETLPLFVRGVTA
jgi:NAD-dependent deacetylase